MKVAQKAKRRILSSVFLYLPLVAIILSVVAWFYSPWIGTDGWRPFDAPRGRILLIAGIWGFVLLWLLIVALIRWRRNRAMEADLVAQTAGEPEDAALKAEMDELRTKLREALAKLRKTPAGRKSLYDLPWYVMIGPPGAGKTTAIVNSGLQFPLANDLGKGAIGGVGGTRNCDWWFTDNAVMIDTAGRYTTQDSDQEADNSAWQGFLNLLKKYRTRQPINGAIIAISLSDLSLTDDHSQKLHARAIRRRLHELREKLGVRFPVYVMFTKADLIAGFTEFFDGLSKEDREQVWGFTLPIDRARGEVSPIAAFDTEFDALLAQMNAQLLERMQIETDPQRRALVAGFPAQVASLRGVAKSFLAECFADSRFEERQMLRGIYFASGTQEGTPIDRLMMTMARTFGIGRQAIGSGKGVGRSYFLTRLFDEVIFPEAGLVSADDRVERRYKLIKRGAIAATIVFALGMGALWGQSFVGNRALLAETEAGITAFTAQAAEVPGNPISDTDLPGIVTALNTLRDMAVNPIPAQIDPERPSPYNPETRLTWGLYQGDILANDTQLAYRAALNDLMLPRLVLRLEEIIQSNINNPDLLFEALKVYLMLGSQGPMDAALVRQWMEIDWLNAFPGDQRAELRADLLFHLDAMLRQPLSDIGLNGPLVDQVQGILSEMPLAERVYTGIINSPEAQALEDFRVSVAGGPAVARVFVRSSGKQLSDGIEGIYTWDGFNNLFAQEVVTVAERVRDESWVLGPRGEAQQTEEALAVLSRDVLGLYYDDFVAEYDQLLGDLDIVPLESLAHAVEVTNVLSGSNSPIRLILEQVSEQTKLAESRADPAQAVADQAGGIVGEAAIDDFANQLTMRNRLLLERMLATAEGAGGEPEEVPGQFVQDRFRWLHDLTAKPDGQPSQLDALIERLVVVYQDLNRMSFNGGVAEVGEGGEALLAFQEAASRIEGPVPRWSQQITLGGAGIAADGTRAGIDAAWKAQVLPVCQQALTGRYPFDRGAAAEVGLTDFNRLFAPDGLIDGFFKQNLAELVDTRARPWTWNEVNGVDLGISDAVLAQFQAAAEIRDAFFPQGSLGVQFQVVPFALDTNALIVSLDVDGQILSYQQGNPSPAPMIMTWPGSVGRAQVGFGPEVPGTESLLKREGAWGWFRILDAATIRPSSVSDRFRLIFNVGGRLATFDVQMMSVVNAFDLGALETFQCPESF